MKVDLVIYLYRYIDAGDEPDPNLPMPLRPDPAAHPAPAARGRTVRLPLPGDPRRAAGQGIQASRLFADARPGRGAQGGELGDLPAADEAHARTQGEPRLPAGLRERERRLPA